MACYEMMVQFHLFPKFNRNEKKMPSNTFGRRNFRIFSAQFSAHLCFQGYLTKKKGLSNSLYGIEQALVSDGRIELPTSTISKRL